jgi:hypothetical protein
MMSRRFLVLVVLLAELASGCDVVRGQLQDDPPPRTAAYLRVDRTGSTAPVECRLNYYRSMQYLFRHAGPGAIFVGDPITRDSLAATGYVLSGVFPGRDSETTDPIWNDAAGPIVKRLEREARELLQLDEQNGVIGKARTVAGQPQRGTALLDAFLAPATFFSDGEGRKAGIRQIWIFSDAVEQSDRWDFASENLTHERIQKILEKEKATGNMPSLTGVELHFVGAGAVPYHLLEDGRVGTLTPLQLRNIRDFWFAWAAATGAKMQPDWYVPALRDWTVPDPDDAPAERDP